MAPRGRKRKQQPKWPPQVHSLRTLHLYLMPCMPQDEMDESCKHGGSSTRTKHMQTRSCMLGQQCLQCAYADVAPAAYHHCMLASQQTTLRIAPACMNAYAGTDTDTEANTDTGPCMFVKLVGLQAHVHAGASCMEEQGRQMHSCVHCAGRCACRHHAGGGGYPCQQTNICLQKAQDVSLVHIWVPVWPEIIMRARKKTCNKKCTCRAQNLDAVPHAVGYAHHTFSIWTPRRTGTSFNTF